MFRVVADQLKISEGWVRCGHCADVFDATLYLQPWIPPGQENTPEDFVQAATEPEFEPRHNDELQGEDRDALPVDAPVASEWDVGGMSMRLIRCHRPFSPKRPRHLPPKPTPRSPTFSLNWNASPPGSGA
jgi:predicted Zn finger-like uncharacterized protein